MCVSGLWSDYFYNQPPDYTTLFLFYKKKTCAKRKTMELFLVKVFTEGKKSCW